jgi:protein-tyrosine phosphatase
MSEGHVQMSYSQINDDIWLGTNSCCITHFEEDLLKKGITADISLEAERIDAAEGVETYLWLPTIDKTAPTQKALWLGTDFMQNVIQAGDKVYVHCMNGHGRGPTLVAAYLIKFEGMTTEDAMNAVKTKRPEIHLEEVQIAALKEFETVCNSRSLDNKEKSP